MEKYKSAFQNGMKQCYNGINLSQFVQKSFDSNSFSRRQEYYHKESDDETGHEEVEDPPKHLGRTPETPWIESKKNPVQHVLDGILFYHAFTLLTYSAASGSAALKLSRSSTWNALI